MNFNFCVESQRGGFAEDQRGNLLSSKGCNQLLPRNGCVLNYSFHSFAFSAGAQQPDRLTNNKMTLIMGWDGSIPPPKNCANWIRSSANGMERAREKPPWVFGVNEWHSWWHAWRFCGVSRWQITSSSNVPNRIRIAQKVIWQPQPVF